MLSFKKIGIKEDNRMYAHMYLSKICYCFWNTILKFVFNGSGTNQSQVLLYLVVHYIYSLVTVFLNNAVWRFRW